MSCVFLLQVLCLVGFGPAMILFTYAVSFMFTRVQSNRDFFSVVSMMVRELLSLCLKHLTRGSEGTYGNAVTYFVCVCVCACPRRVSCLPPWSSCR